MKTEWLLVDSLALQSLTLYIITSLIFNLPDSIDWGVVFNTGSFSIVEEAGNDRVDKYCSGEEEEGIEQ